MERKYRLDGLDCANCAAKIEKEISRIRGVRKVTVSFMTTKMTIEADEDLFDDIEKEAERLVRKLESDVKMKRI